MIRRYYIQLYMYLILINNQIATFWHGDMIHAKSWSGADAFPKYYHYWYIFDYRNQVYILATMAISALLFPLEGKYKRYAIHSVILNFSIAVIEDLRYGYYGSNDINEEMYFGYLIAYTIGLFFLAVYNKIFDDGVC